MHGLEDGSTRGDGAEGDSWLGERTNDETSEIVYVFLDNPYSPFLYFSAVLCLLPRASRSFRQGLLVV